MNCNINQIFFSCLFFYRWFREDQNEIVDPVSRSTNQDSVTSAVLKLKPSRADDGAIYRCVVWNRAMPDGMKLETKVTLGVNCEYIAHLIRTSKFTNSWSNN